MSSNESKSGDGDYKYELYKTIKSKMEKDGVLTDIRELLQKKMVELMRVPTDGGSDANTDRSDLAEVIAKSNADLAMESMKDSASVKSVLQLIQEFLSWIGCKYTAEMVAAEAKLKESNPKREIVERGLMKFNNKNVPCLFELIAKLIMYNEHEFGRKVKGDVQGNNAKNNNL